MGIIKRQGLKTSIVNYIGVLIGVVFINFIFPHLISKENLGLITFLQSLTILFFQFTIFGFGGILIRNYALWKQENEIKIAQFNGFSLFLIFIAFLLFSLIYIGFKPYILNQYKDRSPLFSSYFYVIIPLVFIAAFTSYFEIFSLIKKRIAVPSFLREIGIRVLLILVIFLFSYKILTLDQLVYSLPIVYLIPLIILVFYSYKILKFKTAKPFAYSKNNPLLKTELLFGVSILLNNIFSSIHNYLDGVMIPAYLGLGALGIYMRPLLLGQMIQVPYRAIATISSPIIREAFVSKDYKKLEHLCNGIGINLFLIGCFLFTLVILNTDGIFSLLPIDYSIGKNVLLIIGIGKLIDMAFGVNNEIITHSDDYKFMVYFYAIMVVLVVILNILLIPKLGISGAALASTISLVVFNVLKTGLIYHKFGFHGFSKHYISLILISFFVLGIMHFVPFFTLINHHKFLNSILNILFKSTLGIILFIIPTYTFKISQDLNDFLKLVLSGKIFKGGHKMESL